MPGMSLSSLSIQPWPLPSRGYLLDTLIPCTADLWQPQLSRVLTNQEQQPLTWSLKFNHFRSCQKNLQTELQRPRPAIVC